MHAGSASSSTAFVAHAHAIQAVAVTADAADCATGANACGADLAWVHALVCRPWTGRVSTAGPGKSWLCRPASRAGV
ncbi:hypothetical protein J4714_13895 [Staphylococcus epidermidis]|nr:hypothetical protein [Staphylococcus epidermidis]